MPIFKDYAAYYDLLYQNKDYEGESGYVDRLIKKYHPCAKTVLDLGCGTGRHAHSLAKRGYQVTGIERSESMLSVAKELEASRDGSLVFHQGDIRDFSLNQTFDAVISLFHVISYLEKNEDLEATLSNIRRHLDKGGIFIFDFWYGPAVLTDRPSTRHKMIENDVFKISRFADPVMFPNDNRVDVHYSLTVEHKKNGFVHDMKETHKMRYWFMPEILMFLERAQLEVFETGEWFSAKSPGFDTWVLLCTAKAL